MISQDNEISLYPGERVSIPFYFLSFTTLPTDGHGERTVPVNFRSTAHGNAVALLLVQVHPRPFAVDRTVRFYEAGGAILKRCVKLVARDDRVFQQPNRAPPMVSSAKFVHCPDDRVVIEWRNKHGPHEAQEIYLKFRCGDYPSSASFYVLLYNDQYHASLHEIWHVTVQSMLRLDIHATVRQGTPSELVLKGELLFWIVTNS